METSVTFDFDNIEALFMTLAHGRIFHCPCKGLYCLCFEHNKPLGSFMMKSLWHVSVLYKTF